MPYDYDLDGGVVREEEIRLVSGLEAGVAIAGKFLAPHAGKASLALAKKATYRWRVEREVRRRVDVKYSKRLFRSWLKSMTYDELAKPVEVAGAQLALKLDQWFEARDGAWSGRVDRISQALRLVEAMYLAILKSVDPELERQLSEQWGRQRNEDLVERLVELAGGNSPVGPSDLAVWLRRRSAERRRIRLAALDVDPSVVEEALQEIGELVPNLLPGSFKAIVGSFGAGKSEIAEEWHRQTVLRLSNDERAPIPVWLHAREVAGGGLEAMIALHVGAVQLRAKGIAVVVDGIDEVDGATAEAIARDARVLVAGDRQSLVLATCRTNVLPESRDDITVEGLSEKNARALVEKLEGGRHTTWNWTPELVETIRRPFFALAAGSLLASGQVPSGQVELMAKLVERALRSASSGAATSSRDLFGLLVKLGISLTRSNGMTDGLSFHERQLALSTRLVCRASRDTVAFALPIFEQWFAAQGVLDRTDDLVDEALARPSSFDRWRWAIAIAVLNGTREHADDLIEACLRMNPGAGAWVVEQVSHRGRPWGASEEESLELAVAGQRLLRATRAWINALGPLAQRMFPVANETEPIRLGLRVNGRRIDLGWSLTSAAADEVVPLPTHIHIFSPRNEKWRPVFHGLVPNGTQWPWTKVRDIIADRVLPLLESDALLGPPGGIWHQERRYRAARTITATHTVLHEPLDRVAIINAAERLLSATDPAAGRVTVSIGTRRIKRDEITDLLFWLQGENFASLERPVPTPDLKAPTGGWVWDFYTPEHLVRFCAEMFGLACVAYEEMADTVLPTFGWSLGMNACRQFGIIGIVTYSKLDQGKMPSLEYEELPMEFVDNVIAKNADLTVSKNGRAAIRSERAPAEERDWHAAWQVRSALLTDWAAQHDVESPFWNLGSSRSVIECAHERPVSHQAAQWIWHDLKRLSLGKGTFPQLSR